jgi:hypothetical protein
MNHVSREPVSVRPSAEPLRVDWRVPTAGQVRAFLELLDRLDCKQTLAGLVRGSHGTGKSAAVDAALRKTQRPSCSYSCRKGISPPVALTHIAALIAEATAADSQGFTLVVEQPQRVLCREAFVRAVKRLAAANGFSLICVLDDGPGSDDIAHAFSRRTHGIRTVATIIVQAMDEKDALRFTLARWEINFPCRPTPEHLAHTLWAVSAQCVGEYDAVWSFASALYRKSVFVSPGQIWEYRRPAQDDESDAAFDPNGGAPFYPDPEVLMEVEMELDNV